MTVMLTVAGSAVSAQHLDRPIVGAVFFYWYEWDDEAEWGNWLGGVHNTPLYGYYDNRKVRDNFRSLLLAADWGLTHFFIDYWGHDWRGENNEPREMTVLKAAERVRALGYPIFIGYYQDGENFAMREFWRNIGERRDTYRWLRDYARSPAWTWLFGKPFQMVYARNGVPEVTIDHEGFQSWLRQRYGSIDKLNAEWGTNFRDFSEIRMNFNAVGFQRAMSIAYQYERWRRDWEKLEQLIRDEFGLPGLRVSFDVGYSPFRGFGFERFIRTFGGPHSYAGIFGQPHEQDAERFLQAMVAKKCGTVFFDHLKHRYFDWNIRVPGTAYPPEPHHFDRFWVGNLMRLVDGVLHLSWNEWWEGSNLEPSFEGGKRFCETNLLYSTIWQLTYRDGGRGAQDAEIGLLVNDWIFEHGGGDARDLYNAVQGLRSINAPFDIVLQSEATLENLKRYRVLIAPAGGVGFGFNGRVRLLPNQLLKFERIGDAIREWLQLGGKMLIVSQGGIDELTKGLLPDQLQTFGSRGRLPSQLTNSQSGTGDMRQGTQGKRMNLSPAPRPSSRPFNFFVDIGSPGDEIVLVQGFSHREDWGKLPKGAFGAGSQATIRWTPAVGNATVILLPTDKILAISEGTPPSMPKIRSDRSTTLREVSHALVLRWHGSAIWQNSVRIFVNEQFVNEVKIDPGWRVYEAKLPASVIGDAGVIEVRFEFAEAHVPGEKEPQRFRGEQRVCNLALDWVQICTPDVPIGERKGVKWQPTELARFIGKVRHFAYTKQFRAPLRRRRAHLPEGEVLSAYSDGIPRDLLLTFNSSLVPRPSSLLFVNGIFTDDPRWWATVLEQVSKVPCGKFVRFDKGSLPDHPDLMSAVLTAGTTRFLLVENRKGEIRRLSLTVPSVDKLPTAEVIALSHDGNRFVPRPSSRVPFFDSVRYYAVYQVVFAPVRLSMPKWVAFSGQRTNLPIRVQNLTDEPITVSLQIDAVVASIKGEPVAVRLKPREQRQIALPVEVKPFADWGVKTVFVKGTWGVGHGTRKTAYWLRPLIVGRNADVRCLTNAVTSHTPTVTIVNAPTTPFGDLSWWHPALDVPGETARDVELVLVRSEARSATECRQEQMTQDVSGLRSANASWLTTNPQQTLEDANLPPEIRIPIGDLHDGELKQIHLPLPFAPSPVSRLVSLVIRWRDSAGVHEQRMAIKVTLLPRELPKVHPDQIATIVIADAELVQGTPMSVELPESIKGDAFVVRMPDGTPLPTHTEKLVHKRRFANASWLTTNFKRVHFIVPPAQSLWRIDIGSEGDEQVLVRGFSYRETWANGLTIRWLPGEGRETVLRIPKPDGKASAYRLKLHGQAHWGNRVSVFVGERKLAELDIKVGQQTLTVLLPVSFWGNESGAEIRLIFHQTHVPAERIPGSTDKRICNFALDWLSLEPVFDGQPLLLALCRTNQGQSSQIAVQVHNGIVRVDNGALELEWREDAGGTLTKFRSKATGRDYAAQSCGAGIGVFGHFNLQNPAITTDRFIIDDFVWQRNCKAKVRVVEQNPVWVTVEVNGTWDKGHGAGKQRQEVKATQQYRVFAGLPLIELSVAVEPRPAPRIPRPEELVVLEARFNTRWWTKSFPNFVGLGDKPPEVYGQHIVHFGWRMGNWVPPILCLFNPNDLGETLSLLIVENASSNLSARLEPRPSERINDGANWVRQGFWGEQRGKPATGRKYATIELIAKPPKPVRLRLWLWLHEGHHQQAKQQRWKLLSPSNFCIIPSESKR